MDPDANLTEQQSILLQLLDAARAGGDEGRQELRQRLNELREAMRDWLAKGGFEPHWSYSAMAAHNFRRWNNQ